MKLKHTILFLFLLFLPALATFLPHYYSTIRSLTLSPDGTHIVLFTDDGPQLRNTKAVSKIQRVSVVPDSCSEYWGVFVSDSTLWSIGDKELFVSKLYMKWFFTKSYPLETRVYPDPFVSLNDSTLLTALVTYDTSGYRYKERAIVKIHIGDSKPLKMDTLALIDSTKDYWCQSSPNGIIISLHEYGRSEYDRFFKGKSDDLDELYLLEDDPVESKKRDEKRKQELLDSLDIEDRQLIYITEETVDTIYYKRRFAYQFFDEDKKCFVLKDYITKEKSYLPQEENKTFNPLNNYTNSDDHKYSPNGRYVVKHTYKLLKEESYPKVTHMIWIKDTQGESSWTKLFQCDASGHLGTIVVSDRNIAFLTQYDTFVFYNGLTPGLPVYVEDHYDKSRWDNYRYRHFDVLCYYVRRVYRAALNK